MITNIAIMGANALGFAMAKHRVILVIPSMATYASFKVWCEENGVEASSATLTAEEAIAAIAASKKTGGVLFAVDVEEDDIPLVKLRWS